MLQATNDKTDVTHPVFEQLVDSLLCAFRTADAHGILLDDAMDEAERQYAAWCDPEAETPSQPKARQPVESFWEHDDEADA